MIFKIVTLVLCHLLGDYGIHREFISTTKGDNWYHLFVHCSLYCLPFMIISGINFKLLYIFVTHMIIDALKARYNRISYTQDQVLHYIAMLPYLF
jgi:hypothetical protein